MKILITWYPLMDPGGLTNHIEHLGVALKRLGHEVTFVSLVWKDRVTGVRDIDRGSVGVFGYSFDQRWGWHFPAHARIPYKGKENIERWKEYASKFDIVFWEIPVPPINAGNRGNTDWLELYNLPKSVKQQIITHDGNLAAYPHVMAVLDRVNSVAAVHACAYEQAKALGLPRCMIGSPHNVDNMPRLPAGYWAKRARKWLSVQTFKRWKRVDDIVRAVPLMHTKMEKYVAGGGIEYYYMNSPDKTKPIYMQNGERIWDIAVRHGMQYMGWIDNWQRDMMLATSRALIDASYSHKYAKSGDHFNRVTFEAARYGAVAIVRTHGSVADLSGTGPVLKHNVNCIAIKHDSTPREFADTVNYAVLGMPGAEAELMVHNCREVMRAFDRMNAARHMLNAVLGKTPTGALGFCAKGNIKDRDADMVKAGKTLIASHFQQ